jgi:hypothetical protein
MRRGLAGFVAAAVAIGFPPVAAHLSDEHGQLAVSENGADPVPGDEPHVTCEFWFHGTGLEAQNVEIYFIAGPMRPQGIFDGRATLQPDGTFSLEPIQTEELLAPGRYVVRSDTTHNGTFDGTHMLDEFAFWVDGPCAPAAVPCPANLAATITPEDQVWLTWEDHDTANFTAIEVHSPEGQRTVILPAGTETWLDDRSFAGADFHYNAEPAYSPYNHICDWLHVELPGPRTYFPCPSDVEIRPLFEGVRIDWQAGGTTAVRVHRAESGTEPRLLYEADEYHGSSYTDMSAVEGKAYDYVITALYEPGWQGNFTGTQESPGCPVSSLAAGWQHAEYQPPVHAPGDPSDSEPPLGDGNETAEVPSFPSSVASIVAVAAGVLGYAWIRRRNG